MLWIVASLLLVLTAAALGTIALFQYLRYRGDRFVTCPETRATVPVAVDASGRAFSAVIGHPQLRLRECARWPERQDCGQQCLAQIEASPEQCLVRNVVARWYAGKSCAVCGQPFAALMWHDHPPALAADDGSTLEWKDVPLARLPEFLEARRPVCWNCHVAQTFLRRHPELIVERKRSE